MSSHSYTRLWTHLIWETLNREPMLEKRAAAKASAFLWLPVHVVAGDPQPEGWGE